VSFRERAIEHGTRETVDLHDDQPPPDSLGAVAATESADQAIEGALYEQKQMVQSSAPSRMRKNSQDAQKDPDARRRPTAAREA
jgi:hypothetical protein